MPLNTAYYHQRVSQIFRFFTLSNKRVLYYGPLKRNPKIDFNSSFCQVVTSKEPSSDLMDQSDFQAFVGDYEDYEPTETYDCIILNSAIGETSDICRLLKNVRKASHASTRVIIYQNNHLWQGIIDLATRWKLKDSEQMQNWLSVKDIKSCLNSFGFQIVFKSTKTVFPLKCFFLGPLLNMIFDLLPFISFLKLDQFIVARPQLPADSSLSEKSLSIVLTVRNEKNNIDSIIQSLPQVCPDQEIIFVEGHSTDGTREEISRVAGAYPSKNIKLLIQPGDGQGDAIRTGFKNAKGDVIILYEGDGTSDPKDIQYFYQVMQSGKFEFIEGSRFIYPLSVQAMPFLNKIGNMCFALWFSWFLKRHTTDVLSGIKAVSREEFNNMEPHWGFLGIFDPFGDFELLYGATRFGLKSCEIPMSYRPRQHGESKTKVFKHGWNLFKMALRGFIVFRLFNIKEEK